MWQVLGRATKAQPPVLGPFVTQSDGRAETRTADCVRVRTSLYYSLAQPCTGSPKGRCSVCVFRVRHGHVRVCACVFAVPLVVFCDNRMRVISTQLYSLQKSVFIHGEDVWRVALAGGRWRLGMANLVWFHFVPLNALAYTSFSVRRHTHTHTHTAAGNGTVDEN